MPTQKIVSIGVQEPYRTYLLNGTKTVEGRLNKGKFLRLQAGDILDIEGVKFEITGTKVYPTFLEMVTEEGVTQVILDKQNPAEAAQVYYHFFTPEQEKEFGVKAIRITKV